jgi:hypothetical protein
MVLGDSNIYIHGVVTVEFMVAFLMPLQDKPLDILVVSKPQINFRVFQGKGPTVKLRDWSNNSKSPDFTARNQLNGSPITNRFVSLQVTTPKIPIHRNTNTKMQSLITKIVILPSCF